MTGTPVIHNQPPFAMPALSDQPRPDHSIRRDVPDQSDARPATASHLAAPGQAEGRSDQWQARHPPCRPAGPTAERARRVRPQDVDTGMILPRNDNRTVFGSRRARQFIRCAIDAMAPGPAHTPSPRLCARPRARGRSRHRTIHRGTTHQATTHRDRLIGRRPASARR